MNNQVLDKIKLLEYLTSWVDDFTCGDDAGATDWDFGSWPITKEEVLGFDNIVLTPQIAVNATTFMEKVIANRATELDLKLSIGGLLTLLFASGKPGVVGIAMMFLSALKHVQVTVDAQQVITAEFIFSIWKKKPSAEFLAKTWDKQKIQWHGDRVNLIDVVEPDGYMLTAEEVAYYTSIQGDKHD